jgi:hypothetical protein
MIRNSNSLYDWPRMLSTADGRYGMALYTGSVTVSIT